MRAWIERTDHADDACFLAPSQAQQIPQLASACAGHLPRHFCFRGWVVPIGLSVAPKLGHELGSSALASFVGHLDEPLLSRCPQRVGSAQYLRRGARGRSTNQAVLSRKRKLAGLIHRDPGVCDLDFAVIEIGLVSCCQNRGERADNCGDLGIRLGNRATKLSTPGGNC